MKTDRELLVYNQRVIAGKDVIERCSRGQWCQQEAPTTIRPFMNAPMVGTWSVEVRGVQPYTIHGDLYYDLYVLRTDEPVPPGAAASHFALRVPQHAAESEPQIGDRLVVTFLMGQVTGVKKMSG